MTFGIVLTHQPPNLIYKPGQPVKGFVILESDYHEPIEALSITFVGCWESDWRTLDYKESGTFFLFRKDLFQGQSLPPGHYEWPFEFVFPASAPLATEDLATMTPPPLRPLPPTYSFAKKNDTIGNSDSVTGGVQYILKAHAARMASATLKTAGDLKQDISLQFVQPRTEELLDPRLRISRRNAECISAMLAREESHKISMKQRMQFKFKPSTMPKAAFSVLLEIPSVSIAGTPPLLFLGIDYNFAASTVPFVPTVILRKLRVTLRSHNHVRSHMGKEYVSAAGLQRPVESRWPYDINLTSTNVLLLAAPNAILTERLDLRPYLQGKQNSSFLTPTFTSINMATGYSLRVTACLECGGKLLDFNFDPQDVHMLSPVLDLQAPRELVDPSTIAPSPLHPRFPEMETRVADVERAKLPELPVPTAPQRWELKEEVAPIPELYGPPATAELTGSPLVELP